MDELYVAIEIIEGKYWELRSMKDFDIPETDKIERMGDFAVYLIILCMHAQSKSVYYNLFELFCGEQTSNIYNTKHHLKYF